jgi:uncharacterized protein (TIGR04141 family)
MEASIYLLLKGSSASSTIKSDALTEEFDASSIGQVRNGIELGKAYAFPSSESVPHWVNEVSTMWSGVSGVDLSSAKSGVVLEIHDEGRTFLISFGLGHLKIDKKGVVHDFGRRVAINGVDPRTVKQVSRQALEGSFIQAVEHAAKSGSVYQFGIDVERDLLQGIYGRCKRPAYGKAIGGATPLRVSIDGGFRTLISRLPIYLKLYEQKIREVDFKWYERIKVVQDAAQIALLDAQLDAQIATGGTGILLGLPQSLEGVDQICGFRFEKRSPRRPPAVYPDPEFHDWVSWCRTEGLPLALATVAKRSIFVDFQSGSEISFPVSDCIFWEYTNTNGEVFIRHDGKWFKIDFNFVAMVKAFFAALPPSSLPLIPYTGGTEAAYNISMSAAIPGSEVLDGNNVTLASAGSAIEPCDVYLYDKASKSGRMFFVKRKKVGSSGLTHLFSQVLAGVDSFFHHDHAFRSAMNSRFNTASANLGFRPTTLPDASKWKIVVVICDMRRAPELPFLSQVSLKRVIESLRARYNLQFEFSVV